MILNVRQFTVLLLNLLFKHIYFILGINRKLLQFQENIVTIFYLIIKYDLFFLLLYRCKRNI